MLFLPLELLILRSKFSRGFDWNVKENLFRFRLYFEIFDPLIVSLVILNRVVKVDIMLVKAEIEIILSTIVLALDIIVYHF